MHLILILILEKRLEQRRLCQAPNRTQLIRSPVEPLQFLRELSAHALLPQLDQRRTHRLQDHLQTCQLILLHHIFEENVRTRQLALAHLNRHAELFEAVRHD